MQLICEERPQLCKTHCNKMVKSWAALVNLWLKYVLDLNRTFPDNVHFRKTSNPCMQKSLANVLVAYGHHNPAVGYCQVEIMPYCFCFFRSMHCYIQQLGLLLLLLLISKILCTLILLLTSRAAPEINLFILPNIKL